MANELHIRRKRRERKDYTKEPIVRWFIYLLIAAAAFLIIQTVAADRVKETGSVPADKKPFATASAFTFSPA